MVKVAVASLMGTVIEFYDFLIYATAAALVFAHVFFPALGESAGTVASFATLGNTAAALAYSLAAIFGGAVRRWLRPQSPHRSAATPFRCCSLSCASSVWPAHWR